MCGIAGFIQHTAKADAQVLENMLNAISYRGPDDLSGFVSKNIALGSVRLSIVDIEGGAQPLANTDRDVVIVFNGEIFNCADLRSTMEAQGIAFNGRSEIETLLKLYLSLGSKMFELIKGQFAIAIWDGRKNKLTLARDRVGIRPLYWKHDENGFAFASEIKAICQWARESLTLNSQALLQTFQFWTTVGNTAPFEGIFQIPAGHYLEFDGKTAHLESYWKWPIPETLEPISLPTDDAYADAFLEQFEASVKRQAMADVPVASYLSGGIDSSAVAAVYQQQAKDTQLKTYSVNFNDAEYDETDAQKKMVSHAGFDHTTLNITSADIAKCFTDVVWHAETSLYRTAAAPMYLLSKRVRADGIKVVLTGEGADEILFGYDVFREAAIRRFWSRQPDSQCRGHLLKRLYSFLPQFRDPRTSNMMLEFYRRTIRDVSNPHFGMAIRWSIGEQLSSYLSAEFKSATAGYNPMTSFEQWAPPAYFTSEDTSKVQAAEAMTLLSNYLLSSQGDRASMAHSVEGRYPYLDDEFIMFCARLPKRVKLRGLKDKLVLRNAMRAILPPDISARPKFAFHAPDINSFISNGRFVDTVDTFLDPDRIRKVGLFDLDQVERLKRKALETTISRIDYRDNMAFVLILSTMILDHQFVQSARNAVTCSTTPIRLI